MTEDNLIPSQDYYADDAVLGYNSPRQTHAPEQTTTYVSTPDADAFRETTTTLVLSSTPSDAWVAAHSIIDSYQRTEGTATLHPEEACIPLARDSVITELKVAPVGELEWIASNSDEQIGELEVANSQLRDEIARYRNALRGMTKKLGEVTETLAKRKAEFEQGERDVLNASFTLGALRRTLTDKEAEQFEEGLSHLLTVEASERDIEDAEREIEHLQAEMTHQRGEFESRYAHSKNEPDREKLVRVIREAALIEADYRRNRSEVDKHKQTLVRAKQIAAEHAISGRAYICAAFARSPELPTKPKLTVDEKLNLANLQTMAD